MTDLGPSPDKAGAERCWQCGAPASAGCAYRMRLSASSGRRLDSRGYARKRSGDRDIVTVEIPRCRPCRSRARKSLMIIFAVTLVACIVAPLLQSKFWPQFDTPADAALFQYGIGNTAAGVGLAIGFVVSLLGTALYMRHLRIRSLDTYPAVRMLRREGWRFPLN